MVGGPGTLAPEVPLAREESLVAGLLHDLGQGDLGGPQVAVVLRGQVTVVAAGAAPSLPCPVSDPSGDAVIGGVLAGQYAGSRGTADLAGGVTAGELHAFLGDPVDVRALVIGGSLVAEVAPSEIVGQNENHIGLLGQGRRRGA